MLALFIMYYAHFRCRFSVTGYLSNLAQDDLCPFGDEIAKVLDFWGESLSEDGSRIHSDASLTFTKRRQKPNRFVYKWFIKIRGKVELKGNM